MGIQAACKREGQREATQTPHLQPQECGTQARAVDEHPLDDHVQDGTLADGHAGAHAQQRKPHLGACRSARARVCMRVSVCVCACVCVRAGLCRVVE